LEKAGAGDAVKDGEKSTAGVEETRDEEGGTEMPKAAPQNLPKPTNGETAKPTAAKGKPPAKKAVSFADDTKSGHESPNSSNARRLEQIMRTAKDQEAMSAQQSVIPEDESPEDAELRREMLRYGMSDIGPIVAELELEEGRSGEDEEFDYTDEDDEDDEGEEDEEDEYGRAKYSYISDDYRRRMRELEERLGVKASLAGEQPSAVAELPDEGIGRISVAQPPRPLDSSTKGGVEPGSSIKSNYRDGKSAEFANELGASPVISPSVTGPTQVGEGRVSPFGDIVERSSSPEPFTSKKGHGISAASTSLGSIPPGPEQAPVRFLDSHRNGARFGPDGQTIADTVLERDVSPNPNGPDEFDVTLLHQEAAIEYNRLRNRIIHKEGGFLKEDNSPIQPLDDQEGGPRRVSRFKAARLSRQ
jgi:unconventional prefoldin RPB5 interactor 1